MYFLSLSFCLFFILSVFASCSFSVLLCLYFIVTTCLVELMLSFLVIFEVMYKCGSVSLTLFCVFLFLSFTILLSFSFCLFVLGCLYLSVNFYFVNFVISLVELILYSVIKCSDRYPKCPETS